MEIVFDDNSSSFFPSFFFSCPSFPRWACARTAYVTRTYVERGSYRCQREQYFSASRGRGCRGDRGIPERDRKRPGGRLSKGEK